MRPLTGKWLSSFEARSLFQSRWGENQLAFQRTQRDLVPTRTSLLGWFSKAGQRTTSPDEQGKWWPRRSTMAATGGVKRTQGTTQNQIIQNAPIMDPNWELGHFLAAGYMRGALHLARYANSGVAMPFRTRARN